MHDDLIYLPLFVISFISNFISALAGGGAGLIQLPALILFGLPFSSALSTHKLASVALGLGATLRHIRARSINLSFSLYILLWGLPGVWLGSRSILLIPDKISTFLLGLLTLILGIYSYFRRDLGSNNNSINHTQSRQLLGGLVLLFIGFLNGSLTSGTGLFVTIWLIHWFGFNYARAVAYTLVLVGLFWNATGALTLGMQGYISWKWIPSLLLGSSLGGYLGSHFGIKLGSSMIKRVFEIVAISMGFSMISKSFNL